MNQSKTDSVPVDEATAERHKTALATVQRLLDKRDVGTRRVQVIRAGLHGPRLSAPPDARGMHVDWHSPVLEVTDPDGRMRATVMVGRRSGCYLVKVEDELTTVDAGKPERVVELITRRPAEISGRRAG